MKMLVKIVSVRTMWNVCVCGRVGGLEARQHLLLHVPV
jgi:hypothetical protein